MSPSESTTLCVHGSWHSPANFGPLAAALKVRGHTVDYSLSLPGTGSSPPSHDFNVDVQAIRNAVLAILETQDCFVLCHSWGAAPTGPALEGLDKASRIKEGKKTSVIGILIVAGMPLRKDENITMQMAERFKEFGLEFTGPPEQPYSWPEVSLGILQY
jgi:pimeloyl-ACP methyl ester carboxylesterase